MAEQDWARPVVFFEIRGRDRKRLQQFYAELFNWKIDDNEAINYGLIAPGIGGPEPGVGGGLGHSETPGVSIYVQVRDLGETLEKAVRLGGEKTHDPIHIPGRASIAQIRDPEGNLVGLIQQ
jgi:predicted enzyme related to lactoylglutathione lyase